MLSRVDSIPFYFRYLTSELQFIDPNKIGVYGWGYGGYTALNALADDSANLLQCAIAIAPIISFKLYCTFIFSVFITSPLIHYLITFSSLLCRFFLF